MRSRFPGTEVGCGAAAGDGEFAIDVEALAVEGFAKGVHDLMPGAVGVVGARRADGLGAAAAQHGADVAVAEREGAVGLVAALGGHGGVAHFEQTAVLARGLEPKRDGVFFLRGIQRREDDIFVAVKLDGVALFAAGAGEWAVVIGVIGAGGVVAEAGAVGEVGDAAVFVEEEFHRRARGHAGDVQHARIGCCPGRWRRFCHAARR